MWQMLLGTKTRELSDKIMILGTTIEAISMAPPSVSILGTSVEAIIKIEPKISILGTSIEAIVKEN